MLNYKRLHWFPFCPSDWQSKIACAGISIAGEGCLIALASIQWQEGSIPSDRAAISRCLRGYNGPGIDEALQLFVHMVSEPSRLYWPLLEALRQEAAITSHKRSIAGKKGAQKTHSLRPAIPRQTAAPFIDN